MTNKPKLDADKLLEWLGEIIKAHIMFGQNERVYAYKDVKERIMSGAFDTTPTIKQGETRQLLHNTIDVMTDKQVLTLARTIGLEVEFSKQPTIKPGDRVKIIDAMSRSSIGKEDVVTQISGSAPYSARLKNSLGDWPFSSLEVISHD
ncbi:hypothetical protein [Paenibacillus humicus]|uniref:hypothetical protein n=1 Tax=Paenibacillus humicus TaxID=412861 RepID=UPI003D267367